MNARSQFLHIQNDFEKPASSRLLLRSLPLPQQLLHLASPPRPQAQLLHHVPPAYLAAARRASTAVGYNRPCIIAHQGMPAPAVDVPHGLAALVGAHCVQAHVGLHFRVAMKTSPLSLERFRVVRLFDVLLHRRVVQRQSVNTPWRKRRSRRVTRRWAKVGQYPQARSNRDLARLCPALP